ncbi:MAG: DUF4194 domain-containing protein [Gammaproteobacteria bacterium]
MFDNRPAPDFSAVLVHLMKGVLFRERQLKLWQDLLEVQARVIDYVALLGLELALDEAEGYAYLRQRVTVEEESDDADNIPRLIARRPMSYPVSLLCVLLRKKLAEADAGGGDIRVIVSRDDIVNSMRVFLPEQSNEARIVEQIDTHINKVIELGFLRRLKTDVAQFEIQRILKVFVDAEWLAATAEKLRVYREYAERTV